MKIVPLFLLILASFFLGILFGQTNVFGLMWIGALFFMVLFLSGIALIFGLFSLDKTAVMISSGVIGFVLLTGIIMERTIAFQVQLKVDNTDKIIIQLKEHKKTTGTYPNQLTEVGITKKDYFYQVDSLNKEFVISYLVDGWHFRRYSSRHEEWTSGD